MNENERQSIGLCIASRLLILNGRARGDFQGYITYVGYHGCSTVDLILSSEPTLLDPAIFQYLPIFQFLNISSHHKPDLLKHFANNCKNQYSAYSDSFNSKKFCKGLNWPSPLPQKKLPSKSPALLGLTSLVNLL